MNRPATPAPEPRHVVHVIGALRTGGAERMLVNFLGAVDRTRYRHTVLCVSARGELADQVEALGIPVKVFPVRFRRILTDLPALAGWFRSARVDIIHSHMYFASLWSRLAGLKAGVTVFVTTEHGKELWKNRFQLAVGKWLSGKTLRHIAVSNDIRTIRIERDGFDPERVVVIPNGVAVPERGRDPERGRALREELGLPSGGLIVGTVGRVASAKAYPDLLKAMGRLREESVDVHWLQVGDGPDLPALKDLAREMGLESSITFLGMRPDAVDLLQAMDIWAMSSVREGLPVALLEAMASACPILATRVGGIPDAVTHGESAWLVPAGDPDALAAGVRYLSGDPEQAARLGDAARQRVMDRYSIGAVAREIEGIYQMGHVL